MGARLAVLLFVLSVLIAPVQARQDERCCRLPEHAHTLRELGGTYRGLRRQAGSACCNRFNSGLMQVMTALRDSLQPGVPAKRIVALMGRPDLRTSKRYGAIETPSGARLLVYHWRGSHDYLYFVVRRGRVIRSEWYNAWE